MKKSIIISLSFLFLLSFHIPTVEACNGMDKEQCKLMDHKCGKSSAFDKRKEMYKKKSEMRKDMHDIILQAIILLKEEAKSPKSKAKAEELENRLKNHIKEMESHHAGMKAMHKKKHGAMKGTKGKKTCEYSNKI